MHELKSSKFWNKFYISLYCNSLRKRILKQSVQKHVMQKGFMDKLIKNICPHLLMTTGCNLQLFIFPEWIHTLICQLLNWLKHWWNTFQHLRKTSTRGCVNYSYLGGQLPSKLKRKEKEINDNFISRTVRYPVEK